MKNRFSKLLSVLLCLSMLFTMSGMTAFATDETAENAIELDTNGNPVVYVNIVTGDDATTTASQTNPAQSVIRAIEIINAYTDSDGNKAQAATVRISPDMAADDSATTDVKENYNTAFLNPGTPEWTAEITFTSWGTRPYLAFYHRTNDDGYINGPAVFKDINLIHYDGGSGFSMLGNNCTIGEYVRVFRANGDGYVRDPSAVFYMGAAHSNGTLKTGDQTVSLSKSNLDASTIDVYMDSSIAAGKTVNGDVSLTVHSETTIRNIVLNNSGGAKTYNGSVSIVLKDASKVSAIQTTATPTITDGLWLVNNYGSTCVTPTVNGDIYTLNVATPDLVLGAEGVIEANTSGNSDIYLIDESGNIETFDAGSVTAVAPSKAGTYTVGTSNGIEGFYLVAQDTDGVYHYRKLDENGKYSEPLPDGAGNYQFFDSKQSVILGLREDSYDLTTNGYPKLIFGEDGTLSWQERYKQVLDITKYSALNNTANKTYNYEKTTLYGMNVYKYTRNPDEAAGTENSQKPYDNLAAQYGPQNTRLVDVEGNVVTTEAMRYLTVYYYYDAADGENAPFVGGRVYWNQLRLADPYSNVVAFSTTVSSANYSGDAPNVFKANEWSTITIDLFAGEKWKTNATSSPENGPSQWKLWLAGSATSPVALALNEGDALYVGNIVLTNYDPAGTLSNLVFVSENGDDNNSGLSTLSPVKTVAKAVELVKNQEDATVLVDGSVTYDVVESDAAPVEANITFAPYGENATVAFNANYPLVSSTEIKQIGISGEIVTNGNEFNAGADVSGYADITVNNGGDITLEGGRYAIDAEGTSDNYINLAIKGAQVDALDLNGEESVVTVAVPSGSLTALQGNGNIGSLQVILTGENDFSDNFTGTNTSKHIVYLPEQLSSALTYFEVSGTDTPGVFATYSGTGYNFGYGMTTYMIYTYSEDGKTVYYSNENTDYKLTLPSGTYQLEVSGEKTWVTSNNKTIVGFAPSTHLTLPEDYVGWSDNGRGVITATVDPTASAEYYVMYGGTGDGKTKSTPAATVASVISTIKSDGLDKAGTAVRVYIMDYVDEEDDSNSWNNYAGGEGAIIGRDTQANGGTRYNQNHHMTAWTTNSAAASFPAHNATLLITSYDYAQDGKTINHLAFSDVLGPNTSMYFSGPVVLENISIVSSRRDYREFATRGNDVTFGDGVVLNMVKNSAGKYTDSASYGTMAVFHNDMIFVTANANLALGSYSQSKTYNGGSVRIGYSASKSSDRGIAIPTFNTNQATTFNNNVKVYLENTAFNANVNWGSYGASVTDTFNGGLTFVVNEAGTIASSRSMTSAGERNSSNVVINNGYVVICNNGETFPGYLDNVTVNGGEWYINSADTTGKMIDYVLESETGETKTFRVIGATTAKAISSDGTEYYSNGKNLTLPAGTYTVEYLDYTPFEIVSDEENKSAYIKANIDGVTIDLLGLNVPEIEGKLFIGWDSEETLVTLNTNDVVNATYVDFDTAVDAENEKYGDLSVAGAQMRFASGDVKQGLRFVTQLSTSLRTALGIADHPGSGSFDGAYGTVVIPTSMLSGELTLDTENAQAVPAANLFEEKTDYYRFTAVIVDIEQEDYNREYTVRSYVKYTDLNDVERVAYSEPYALALYDMADYILENGESPNESTTAMLETLRDDTVDWMETMVGDYLYSGIELDENGVPTEGSYKKGHVIYKTNSGVRIREIHIDGGTNENAEEQEIAVMSDTHFVHFNDEDWKDAELLFTYKNRYWGRGGTHIPYMKKGIELAGKYDKLVVTGDIIDYLTRGSLEVMKEFMVDPNSDGIFLLGNHDYTKLNESRGVTNMVSEADRLALMQEMAWPHDIEYTQQLIGENVILVGMHNGNYRFSQKQYEGLKSAIETARENGYIVLVFYHIPLSVRGTPDSFDENGKGVTMGYCISEDRNCTLSRNYYYGDVMCDPYDKYGDPYVMKTYELITSSADVVKGLICGHNHDDVYTEVAATYTNESGEIVETVIPQYIVESNAYFKNGAMTKIVVSGK